MSFQPGPSPPSAPVPAASVPHVDNEVALSFAGEQRPYVRRFNTALRRHGVKTFYDYDPDQTVALAGEHLTERLDEIYQSAALVVVFISAAYKDKMWTRHELRAALARAIRTGRAYIIPGRFDDTELPGLPHTIGYIDLRTHSPERFAEIIAAKLRAVRTTDAGTGAAPPATGPVAPVSRAGRLPWPGMPWQRAAGAAAAAALVGVAAVAEARYGIVGGDDAASRWLGVLAGLAGTVAVGLATIVHQRRSSLVPRAGRAVAVTLAGVLTGALLGAGLVAAAMPATYVEVAGNRNGSKLFADPSATPAAGGGVLPYLTQVRVTCKAPNGSQLRNTTHFYRIWSRPWRGLYAPADTFANGDPIGTPGPTVVDPAVPDC